jgi:hypothetical protein
MQKPLFCTMIATLALACSSCGQSPKLYPVTGKVLVKGTPAVGATVFLQRQGVDPMNEQTIMGVSGEDGAFSLVCGPYGEGAPPGEYDVFIEWRHRAERAKGPMATDRLKGHYADRNHPLLHAVVHAEPAHLPPFDLTEVHVTKADLQPDRTDAAPAPKGRGTPRLFLNGKPVDPETAKKILNGKPLDAETAKKMLGGPGKKTFRIEGVEVGPDHKPLLFNGKQGDGEAAPKKRESP